MEVKEFTPEMLKKKREELELEKFVAGLSMHQLVAAAKRYNEELARIHKILFSFDSNESKIKQLDPENRFRLSDRDKKAARAWEPK